MLCAAFILFITTGARQTLGLFVVPVGATLMQGPAIVASLFSR